MFGIGAIRYDQYGFPVFIGLYSPYFSIEDEMVIIEEVAHGHHVPYANFRHALVQIHIRTPLLP